MRRGGTAIGWFSILASAATALACRPEDLYRRWILPQVFVLVLLFIASTTTGQSLELLLTQLCSITYVLFFNVVWLSRTIRITGKEFVLQLGGMVILLTILSLSLSTSIFLTVTVPTLFLIVSGVLLLCPAALHCLTGLVAATPLTIVFLYFSLFQSSSQANMAAGIVLILLTAAGAAFFREVLDRKSKLTKKSSLETMVTPDLVKAVAAGLEFSQDRIDFERTIAILRKVHLAELLAEFGWRLSIGLALLTAQLLVILLIGGLPGLLPVWLVSTSLTVVLLLLFCFVRTVRSIQLLSLAAFLVSLGWWLLLFASQNVLALASMFTLVVITVIFISLPWPFRLSRVVAAILATIFLIQAVFVDHSVVVLLFFSALLLFFWRLGQVGAISLFTRVLVDILLKYCINANNPVDSLRLLAQQLVALTSSQRAVLVMQSGEWEIFDLEGLCRRSDAERVGDVLFEQIYESGRTDQIISTKILSQTCITQLVDCFGWLPGSLHVFAFAVLINKAQQRALILLPVSALSRLAGLDRVGKILATICLSIRNLLAVAQSGTRSSELALNVQKTLAEREREFNRLIHGVNNIVQDITVICDGLLKIEAEVPKHQDQRSFHSNLKQIDGLIRTVAFQVTDFRLLREVNNLSFDGLQRVECITASLSEIARFAEIWCKRIGVKHLVEICQEGKFFVRLAGIHYFEAIARFLVQQVALATSAEQQFFGQVEADSDHVYLRLSNRDLTVSLDPQSREADLFGQNLKGIREYFNACGAVFKFNTGRNVSVEICLERHSSAESSIKGVSDWCLFVDDSDQVSSFYRHIADVLELDYAIAATLDGAYDLISQRGRPGLVVTDIQLGQDSGLTLIAELQQRYQDQVAIVVVSGEVDSLAKGMSLKGISKVQCLAKPLSRRRLFETIQAALGHQSSKG